MAGDAHGRERKANRRGAARLAAVQALYQMEIAGTALNEILAQFRGRRPHFICAVAMDITLGKPDRRKRDIDGLAKALLDRLTGIAYTDDHQVVDLRLRYGDCQGAIVVVRAA